MSKRAGTFVSLDELIDEVGADAARFHLLLFSNDRPMNFDIAEVARQTLENPVYYVQYGHARIASILRKAAEEGVRLGPGRGRRPRAARDRGGAGPDACARRRPGADRDRGGPPGAPSIDARRAGPRRDVPSLLHRMPCRLRRRCRSRRRGSGSPRRRSRCSARSSISSASPLRSRWGGSRTPTLPRAPTAQATTAERSMDDDLEIRPAEPSDARAFLAFWKAIVAEERFVRTEEVRTPAPRVPAPVPSTVRPGDRHRRVRRRPARRAT